MTQAEVIAKLQTIFDTVFLEPVVLTPAISAKPLTSIGNALRVIPAPAATHCERTCMRGIFLPLNPKSQLSTNTVRR